MGYRHYMYIVKRERIDQVKNLTYDELKKYAAQNGCLDEDDEDGFGCYSFLYDLAEQNVFHEFGKHYENAENIYKLGTPLFVLPDTQEYFEEYQPYVVNQDAVLCAIEDYRQKIVKWYKGLLMTQEEYDASLELWERNNIPQEQRIKNHLEHQLDEWENEFGFTAIDLYIESNKIVRSWLYEYEIFELVHQLKTMDWENNTLLFYGW